MRSQITTLVLFAFIVAAASPARATSVDLKKAEEFIRFLTQPVAYAKSYARDCPHLGIGKYIAPAYATLMMERDQLAREYELSPPERLALGEAADEMVDGLSKADMRGNCRWETKQDVIDFGLHSDNVDGHDSYRLSLLQMAKKGGLR